MAQRLVGDHDEYAKELAKAHSNKQTYASRAQSPLRPFPEAQSKKPVIDMSFKPTAPNTAWDN